MSDARSPLFSGPKVLILSALTCFLLGGYLHWAALEEARARGIALESPPPVQVGIDRFQSAQHLGAAGEVRVVAQLDFTNKALLSYGAVDVLPRAFMVPLLPAEAGGDTAPAPLGLLLFPKAWGDMSAADLQAGMDGIVSIGAFGPVVALHGAARGQGVFFPLIYKALFERGHSLPAGALVMEVFDAPRDVALKPQPAGASLILFGGLGVVFMLMAVMSTAYRKGKAAKTASGQHHHIGPYLPAMASGDISSVALHEILVPKPAQDRGSDVYSPKAKAPSAEPVRELELVATTPFAEASHHMSGEAQPKSGESFYARDLAGRPIGTARFGPSIREEIKLSKRARAKLEADPFMQRLARLT